MIITQEDKDLLLKDLSARFPYGVKIKHITQRADACQAEVSFTERLGVYTLKMMMEFKKEDFPFFLNKPYLFPLSSMTDEMLEELNANGFFKYRDTIANVSHLESNSGISEEIYTYVDIECISFLTEFFHSHHIDYRGLIEKGLAIDATGLNVY